MRDEEISIEGFIKEVFRNDHPSDGLNVSLGGSADST